MKPLHLITIILLFLSCGVSRETIRYELPPKQAVDNPDKLQTILAFKTKDAEKLFDKEEIKASNWAAVPYSDWKKYPIVGLKFKITTDGQCAR